jgi:hypothetical protein
MTHRSDNKEYEAALASMGETQDRFTRGYGKSSIHKLIWTSEYSNPTVRYGDNLNIEKMMQRAEELRNQRKEKNND